MRRPKPTGYVVWHRSALRNAAREIVGATWVNYTSPTQPVGLEMAEALAASLDRVGVAWEVRDLTGTVVSRGGHCARCDGQRHDVGSCVICGNTGHARYAT